MSRSPVEQLVARFENGTLDYKTAYDLSRREVAAIDASLAWAVAESEPGPEPEGGAAARRRRRSERAVLADLARASRVLAYVRNHGGATTGAVARPLHVESGEIAGALFELRRSGRVIAAGARSNTTRSTQSKG